MEVQFVLSVLLTALLGLFAGGIFLLWWATRGLPPPLQGAVALFHPFADGGGGGERVLWCAVQAVQAATDAADVYIYAREGVTAEQLVADAQARFNVIIRKPIKVISLSKSELVKPERYPRLTLLGQAYGSVLLTQEALMKLVPEVFIDTTGWAFGYPLAWRAGSKVACYVHYPTISSDMLARVWAGTATYNNDEAIASSSLKTFVKTAYYTAVAVLYGSCGFFSRVTMVNSNWTKAHIERIWFASKAPALVYPPVDTQDLQDLPLDRKLKQLFLVSVNQFRPEKNHRLQLEAFALAKRNAGNGPAGLAIRVARLKMVGGCRNEDDERRLQALQRYAEELGIAEWVDWVVNATYAELKMLLGGAVGGLHSMVDEHFGISVVEYMAAGVIPIANNSGGPRCDIVLPVLVEDGEHTTGYLASTVEEYTDAIVKVLTMDQKDRLKVAAAAQIQAQQFSTERFIEGFSQAIRCILP